jgi:hypothetical protein
MSVQRKLIRWLVAGAVVLLVSVPAVGAGGPVGSDFPINLESPWQAHPAIAYNPDREEYLVVWYNDRGQYDDIYAQRVAWNGRLLGPRFAVAWGSGLERRYPDVAYNPTQKQYLVVWEEFDGSRPRIWGQRLTDTGQLKGPGFRISEPAPKNCFRPAVAYAVAADQYLVVWWRHVQANIATDIEGRAVSTTGLPLGSDVVIAAGTWQADHEVPDVAYNRSRNEFLVAWQREDKSANDYDIYGRRVQGSGTPMGAGAFPIYAGSGDDVRPVVAAIPTVPNQGKYLVAWQSPNLGQDIYARRLKGDGSQDSIPFWLSTNSLHDTEPAAAGSEGGREFLVAWSHEWGGGAYRNVYGRTVPLEGSALGPETDLAGGVTGRHCNNAAATAGRLGEFLVAYEDIGVLSTDPDIYGRLWGIWVHVPLVIRHR